VQSSPLPTPILIGPPNRQDRVGAGRLPLGRYAPAPGLGWHPPSKMLEGSTSRMNCFRCSCLDLLRLAL
jgi:hypothetical protein